MGRRFCPACNRSTFARYALNWDWSALPAASPPSAKAVPHKPGSRLDPGAWTRRFLRLTLTLAGAAMLAGTVPAAAQPRG